MVPQPFFQRQSGGRSAKGLTSQERPPSPTKGRRRSVFSPEPQVPTTVEFELLADEYGLGSVKKSTKAVHLVLPRWSAFSLGVSIGLIIATGIFWMNHWIMFGRKDHHPTSGDLPMLAPPGHYSRNFTPNESFKLGTDGSNDAWRSILPEGLGFVQHPDLGPEIVGLAFVHQLHCLDKLRQTLDTTTNNKAHDPRHLSHCVEYLRHSIMCNADANLEYRKLDPTTNRLETPGDDVHLCRGFGELFHFAEKWRVYDGKTIGEKRRIKEDGLGRTIHYDYVSSRGDQPPLD